jgi:hypothetical protein
MMKLVKFAFVKSMLMVDRVSENFFILLGRAHFSQYFVCHFESRPSNSAISPQNSVSSPVLSHLSYLHQPTFHCQTDTK